MKYRKVTEKYSSELRRWLELINSVPFGKGIYHSWGTLRQIAYFELTGEEITPLFPPSPESDDGHWKPPTYEQQEAMQSAFTKAIKSLKAETEAFPKLHSYLFEIEDYPAIENDWDKIRYEGATRQYENSAHKRYETFLQMRTDIRRIAQSCMLYQRKGYFVDNEGVLEKLGFKRRDKGYHSNLIIKNGTVDFESELIQVLRGIPPERLRICPICDEVFWAKRIEAQTCSEKRCKNNFHQRKLRIVEYEKRFDEAFEKLEKQRQTLPPDSPLIAEQIKLTNKIKEKINREKIKNGNL